MFILHKDIKDQRFLISDLFLYVGIFEENNTLKEGKAMKFVIQRVKEASVKVDDEYTGKIKKRVFSFDRCRARRYKRRSR